MMEDRQEKYFQFPLFMIRGLLYDPKGTLENIFHYGFFRYAFDTLKISDETTAQRCIYHWNQQNNKLDRKLRKMLEDHGFTIDEDYRGFWKGKFNPLALGQEDELLDLFQKDSELYRLCLHHARIETAIYNLGTAYTCHSYLEGIRQHEDDWRSLDIPDREPFPQISIKLLLNYIDTDPDEFSLYQLAANIAINSILGKAKYKKTNKAFIVARMLGYKSPKHLPEVPPPPFEYWMNRYHFDRLKAALQANWKLYFISKGIYGGQYVAQANRINLVDFMVAIKTKFITKKIQNLKKREALAEAEAEKRIQHLYKK